MDLISKENLIHILSREYNDVCTSAMSFASSSSHKSVSEVLLHYMMES